MIITGYYCFRIFLSVRTHFTKSTFNLAERDYKYLKVDRHTYEITKHKKYFEKLSKKVKSEKRLVNLLINVFKNDSATYIVDIVNNYYHYEEITNEWENKLSKFSYNLEQITSDLYKKGMDLNKNLNNFILDAYANGDIDIETYIVFHKVFDFKYQNSLEYDILFKSKYYKYSLMLNINIDKFRKIIVDTVENQKRIYK